MGLGKGELRKLYAQVPAIACQGQCHTSCGPISLTTAEYRLVVRQRGGRSVPYATELGDEVHLNPPMPAMDCPLLTAAGRCSVYAVRPMICRLWGVVESMPCTYGCRPERYLTMDEAIALLLQTGLTAGSPLSVQQARTYLALLTPTQRDEVHRRMRGEQSRMTSRGEVR